MKTTEPPIIVEQTFSLPAIAVWKAITELEQLKQWFFDNIPAFEAKVGFETQFAVQSEERVFTHLWKITTVVPQQQITYRWCYEEYPGDSLVTFRLSESNGQSTLRLSTEVISDFPDSIPEFAHASCMAGWQYFIQQRLKAYLED